MNLPLEIGSQVHEKCLCWHMSTVRSNLEHQNPYGGPSTWCLQSYAVTHVCECITQTIILNSTYAHHSFIRKCDCGQVTSLGHFGFLLKWVMYTAWELGGRGVTVEPHIKAPLCVAGVQTQKGRSQSPSSVEVGRFYLPLVPTPADQAVLLHTDECMYGATRLCPSNEESLHLCRSFLASDSVIHLRR